MNPLELVRLIESAFDGIARPQTSMRQFRLTDLFGMSGEITDKEWHTAGKASADSQWQQIPDAEIEECQCVLSHMDESEFQYYLPAYMRYAIAHYGEASSGCHILGSTVFALNPGKKGDRLYAFACSKFVLLDQRQQLAVRSFLAFIANHTDDFSDTDATAALDTFWGTVIPSDRA